MQITFENLLKAVINLTNEVKETKRIVQLLLNNKSQSEIKTGGKKTLIETAGEADAYLKEKEVVMLNTNNPQHKRQGKDNNYQDQLTKVFQAFFESPKTMKEADKACGVMRENIYWYVRYLRKRNLIAVIRKRHCRVTKHLADELTTDRSLFPKPLTQQILFLHETETAI